MTVLVINRNADTARLGHFRRAAKRHEVKPVRITAVDGLAPAPAFHAWADLIGPHFWGEDQVKPGALGCYLSHYRCWQHVVERGLDWALICEDDVEISLPGAGIDAIGAGLGDLDLLFANDRLCAGGDGSVADALRRLEARAPGADCYFVSRQGAERLVEHSAAHKITCGVDWAMVWGALGAGDALPDLPEVDLLRAHAPAAMGGLGARVATQPAARRRRNAKSTIVHATTRPLAGITGGVPSLAHADHAALIPFGAAGLGFVGRSGNDPVMAAHRDGGLWEEAAIGALLQRFPEGGSFVDIGAHIGNHTVALGRLAGAHVVAVEPNPEIRALLEINIGLNGLSPRVELISEALGAQPGPGLLDIKRRRPAMSKVTFGAEPSPPPEPDDDALPAFDAASPSREVPVEVTTGDDLLGERPVDAIKIDVSGCEMEVLRGLKRVLRRRRPLLLIDQRDSDAERITQFTERLGFRPVAAFAHDPPRRCVVLYLPSARP